MPKALMGTIAAGAMAVSVATPAQAQDRIDGDDIVAGALVIGGLAAIAAILDDDGDRYDRRYDRRYDSRYDPRYNSRYDRRYRAERVVEQCVRTAENEARRAGYRSARVTELRDVDRKRGGFNVKGRMVVEDSRYDRYDRRSRYDRRGDRGRDYDRGSFTCKVRNGRVVDLDFDNIRGLR
ncbi:hypothetical protein QQS45_09970 [Alteriqipengyuania flavescens]|uniref:hypothetical protein n=1 Tax=Alteriqipengyuania flavescens TaxID=3053610 RepID=UPI0025B33A24|nr:hypothetical protein [Alteriqipengyuania flavescens]WJY17950.1 hypothetical protein QQW98_09965 [Alteriqipengyuania flavescens]WJY23891.1 hypothetical protein QQS45_09970 [Alteriqipengyuania flavescens]